jgi:hypothetical protein
MSRPNPLKQRQCAQCECFFQVHSIDKFCPPCRAQKAQGLRAAADVDRITVIVPKPRRTTRCKICTKPFFRRSITHKVCGPECAVALTKLEREQQEARERRAARQALKTRSDWLREAQAAFNAYIRERDAGQPCISCGRYHQGAHDAGHYRSVGAMPALRFNEDNVHRQCVPCNQHKSGNVLEYRLGLIARIGAERVAFLEGPHEAAKYTIEDAKAIKAAYKAKLKALKESAC